MDTLFVLVRFDNYMQEQSMNIYSAFANSCPLPTGTVLFFNYLSPSAQCTEAANKARRLIFIIRRSFQDLSKLAFIPLYEALVRSYLEYGMSASLQISTI